MIKLRKEFTKGGKKFEQIFRDDEMAMFMTGFGSIEIFKILVHQPDRYHDDYYEMYPYNEAFGVWAWCCTTLGSVKKILKQQFPNHPITRGEININLNPI